MLIPDYGKLKDWLECLEKDKAALANLPCAKSTKSLNGILNQAQTAKKHGFTHSNLYFAFLTEDGFEVRYIYVDLKNAINIIKTMKKR